MFRQISIEYNNLLRYREIPMFFRKIYKQREIYLKREIYQKRETYQKTEIYQKTGVYKKMFLHLLGR